jgi:hypothetical protein
VRFDHSKCLAGHEGDDACNASASLALKNGETFDVVVLHTDTTRFTYTIAGVKVTPVSPPSVQADSGDLRTHTITLFANHDAQYGGYIVSIRRKTNGATPPATENRDLGNATIRIAVTTKQWQIGFGSGFTISGLRDPAFGVAHDTARNVDTLTSEHDRRDRASRGLAAFVHVWHPDYDWAALSFGLGVDQGRGTGYFVGPSIRFGDKLTLTAGPVWGSVKTAPSGMKVGSVVKDPNVLNQLGQRTDMAFFVGLSYAFIGGSEDALKKPFASSNTSTTSAGEAGSGGQGGNAAPPAANSTKLSIQPAGAVTVSVGDTLTVKFKTVPNATIALSSIPEDAVELPVQTVVADASGNASVLVTVRKAGRLHAKDQSGEVSLSLQIK